MLDVILSLNNSIFSKVLMFKFLELLFMEKLSEVVIVAVSSTIKRTGLQFLTKNRMADLLSAEVGKHDYDW